MAGARHPCRRSTAATVTRYGGDFGEPLHDGNDVIDGLVAADRTPRAQLADLAAVFAPVVAAGRRRDGCTCARGSTTSTRAALAFRWRVETPTADAVDGGAIAVPADPARGAGVSRSAAGGDRGVARAGRRARGRGRVRRRDTAWAPAGWVVSRAATDDLADAATGAAAASRPAPHALAR